MSFLFTVSINVFILFWHHTAKIPKAFHSIYHYELQYLLLPEKNKRYYSFLDCAKYLGIQLLNVKMSNTLNYYKMELS